MILHLCFEHFAFFLKEKQTCNLPEKSVESASSEHEPIESILRSIF